LGSQEHEPDCGEWQSKDKYSAPTNLSEIIKKYNLREKGIVEEEGTSNYKESFLDVISSIFHTEKDFSDVLATIKDVIQQQGYVLPFQSSLLENHFGKIVELKFLHEMSLLMGMGPYTDKIVQNHIDQLFPAERQPSRQMRVPVQQPLQQEISVAAPQKATRKG
jgi:hypothetical protein